MSADNFGHWAVGVLAAAAASASGVLFRTVVRHDTAITTIETQMEERHAEVKEDLREIKQAIRDLAASSAPRSR